MIASKQSFHENHKAGTPILGVRFEAAEMCSYKNRFRRYGRPKELGKPCKIALKTINYVRAQFGM